MDIHFDDCKNDYNVIVTLKPNEGSGHLLIEWLEESTDSIDIIARRLESETLTALTCGDHCYLFEIHYFYDCSKVAHRVTEWLTAQGYKVSLNLGG